MLSFRRLLPLVPICGGLLLAVAPSVRAQSGVWTNVPHGLAATINQSFSGVAAGNGVFVVTGTAPVNGAIQFASSTDGVTWTAGTIATQLDSASHTRPRFLNGRFIIFAGGLRGTGVNTVNAGAYYTSTDGRNWTANNVTSEFAFLPAEIDYGNGRYVAVGGNGYLIGSTDLTNWTKLTSNLTGIFSYQDVAFGNGRWFITTNGGGTVATSTDGQNFTSAPGLAGAAGGYRVEYGNGIWFFYSQINNAVSTDGITFTPVVRSVTTPGGTGTIRFVNGRFVSPGSVVSPFQASTDGRTWFSLGAYPAVTSIFTATYDFAFGNGKYITAGSITPSLAQIASPVPIIYTIAEADVPAPATPPAITTPLPAVLNAVLGRSAVLSVAASGTGNAYQWLKDNVAIPGATAATYTIASVTAASAGNYAVRITNSLGTVTSSATALTLVSAAQAGRLVNMSIRTAAGAGDATLIVGVGLGGANTSGNKAVLLRGVGPTLGVFGVGGALSDTVMTVFQGSAQFAQNDDWDAAAGNTFAGLGAFAFGAGSRDSAIYNAAIPSGSYSIQIAGKAGATGIALAEIYDATPSANFTATTPRLVNVSARTQVGTGDNILIAGFVVGGSTPVRILIRAVGPTLGAFGVGGALADPKLEVYNSAAGKIGENDNWAGTAELKTAFSSVAAFALSPDSSRDAALIATLQPGSYTVQVSGVNATTGVALVELYELP